MGISDFSIKRSKHTISIGKNDLKYALRIVLSETFPAYQATFKNKKSDDKFQNIIISSENWSLNELEKRGVPLNEDYTYMVVGPGLGNIPIKLCNSSKKVYAIDMFDYNESEILLKKALDLNYGNYNRERFKLLLDRTKKYLNSGIILINSRIENIKETHPELRSKADVVIDKNGPLFHVKHVEPDKKLENIIRESEEFLLKDKKNLYLLTI